jgi:LmbE family N-acetylglucosaminyl deacetylase
MNRVMIISPHPDDETIGCGGTIRKHVVDGDIVHVELLTSGEKGGHNLAVEDVACIREQEAMAAAAILGVAHVECYRQPDGELGPNRVVVARLSRRIKDWQPNTIYVPHSAEQHPDHAAALRLVQRSLRALNLESAPRVLAYEVWTPLQQLDEIVDVTPHMETKLRAISVYRSQTRVMNFAAAAEGLARYRGEMHSWPGGEFAEVFSDVTQLCCQALQKQ